MPSIKLLIIEAQNSSSPDIPDISKILCSEKDFKVVDKIPFDKNTFAHVESLKPQVVIFDLNTVEKKGIELIDKIKQKHSNINILAFTFDTDQHRFYRMIKAGALGYILKDSDSETLNEAIRMVARGDAYIQPYLLTKLITEFRQLSNDKQLVSSEHELTQRELEIVGYIARGKSNKDIAAKLYISEKTVKNHISNILRKMGLTDRTQVAIYAYQKGFVTPKSRGT